MSHQTNHHTRSNRTTATADDHGKEWANTDDVRHTKEDALTDREFERMVEATYRMDDDYFAMECRLVLFCCGRLGMRAGELAHMTSEWIDQSNELIEIPTYEPCTGGRSGGICGHCRNAAKQMASIRTSNELDEHYQSLGPDAVLEPGASTHSYMVDPDRFYGQMWSPKTKHANRKVPYSKASARAAIAIEEYFDRYDEFEASRGVVNRRVTRMAEQTNGAVDPDSVYPHALRGTAATFWAAKGLKPVHMKSLFGWSQFNTGIRYLEESHERLGTALDRLRY